MPDSPDDAFTWEPRFPSNGNRIRWWRERLLHEDAATIEAVATEMKLWILSEGEACRGDVLDAVVAARVSLRDGQYAEARWMLDLAGQRHGSAPPELEA